MEVELSPREPRSGASSECNPYTVISVPSHLEMVIVGLKRFVEAQQTRAIVDGAEEARDNHAMKPSRYKPPGTYPAIIYCAHQNLS